MKEIVEVLFGNYTFPELFGFIWFFLIGYIITAWDETSERDKKSKNTPEKWSWKFWWKDNRKKYVVTVLATYLLFRFYIEFTGRPLTYFECVMLGMVGDGIGIKAKKRLDFLKADRKMIMSEE